MRRSQLHNFVADLLTTSLPDDGDVVEQILADRDDDDGGFGYLAFRLSQEGGEEQAGITQAWAVIADQLTDRIKDRIADGAIESPGRYLAAFLKY